jgi:hypothetical protein
MLKPSEGFLHLGFSGENIISLSTALRKTVLVAQKWKCHFGLLSGVFPLLVFLLLAPEESP